jgi:metallo-beta-lactamase family protein
MRLQFQEAARQVTGSRSLRGAGGLRLLIDCGYFQERAFLGRNWEASPVPPGTIDHVLLTHAHLDHCGLVPKLVSEGFGGSILATAATKDLAEIVLHDSARIQEEDAAFKLKRHQREKRAGPYPVKPLYTTDDVNAALRLFRAVAYGRAASLNEKVTVTFHDAGHILGSAMLEVVVRDSGQSRRAVFSGDVGQYGKPIIRDPSAFEQADYVIMESTYGGRNHGEDEPVKDQLCEVINSTVEAGGNLVIPTFAVERAQELMYYMSELLREDRIPNLIAFLDSPMAVNVTEVFRRHRECMDAEAVELLKTGERLMQFPGCSLVRSVNESKAINRIKGSCIIMAGSGMCTAGRIKHHLVNNISRPECSIAFVGYQAAGTLGRQLVEGAERVRIHGRQHKVKARIAQLHGFSAHADQAGLLQWLGCLRSSPRRLFLVHGEDPALTALTDAVRARWGWDVSVPDYQSEYSLD